MLNSDLVCTKQVVRIWWMTRAQPSVAVWAVVATRFAIDAHTSLDLGVCTAVGYDSGGAAEAFARGYRCRAACRHACGSLHLPAFPPALCLCSGRLTCTPQRVSSPTITPTATPDVLFCHGPFEHWHRARPFSMLASPLNIPQSPIPPATRCVDRTTARSRASFFSTKLAF